jgi:hypothetical protein
VDGRGPSLDAGAIEAGRLQKGDTEFRLFSRTAFKHRFRLGKKAETNYA